MQVRSYRRAESVAFLRTNETYGALSNMAGGCPLIVSGISVPTVEALYQACRFPHLPEVQRLIIDQNSPMAAKMKAKGHRVDTRSDWQAVKVRVMRWCIRLKAQQHPSFRQLVLSTGDRPIVEVSRRDGFWGARPQGDDLLVGVNALGRLLMELRDELRSEPQQVLATIDPPDIPDFLILGCRIGVSAESDVLEPASPKAVDARREPRRAKKTTRRSSPGQVPLAEWLPPED